MSSKPVAGKSVQVQSPVGTDGLNVFGGHEEPYASYELPGDGPAPGALGFPMRLESFAQNSCGE